MFWRAFFSLQILGCSTAPDTIVDAADELAVEADVYDAWAEAEGGAIDCGPTDTPQSCGACNHSCLGGACDGNACQPIVLATYEGGVPAVIAANATDVYFTYVGGQVPAVLIDMTLDGGAQRAIDHASGPYGAYGLAIDSTHAYWTDYAAGELRKAPLGGDGGIAITTASGYASSTVVDAQKVYWVDDEFGGVMRRADLNGANSQPMRPPLSMAYEDMHLALDATNLYYAHIARLGNENGGEVYALELATLVGTPLATKQTAMGDLTVDSDKLYWPAKGTQDAGFLDGKIMMVPTTGGTSMALANNQAWPNTVKVDAKHIYWTARLDGTLRRCDLPSCANATILVSGLKNPDGLAQNGTALFWATFDGGGAQLMMLAK